jgi:hypothetical protein
VIFGYPKIHQHSDVFGKPVFDRAKKEQVVRFFFKGVHRLDRLVKHISSGTGDACELGKKCD